MYIYKHIIMVHALYCLQAFCNKAKAVINAETREAQQLSPLHEDSNNAFFVANIEQVNEIDVRGSNLVFVNLLM